jgi:predicted secreted Zn-dependent protease
MDDSVEEFMKKVPPAVGEGAGVMGVTKFHIDANYKVVDGKVTSPKLSLDVTVTRAHWAGGKADDANKAAIQQAEELNKKHEEKHRKLAETIYAREVRDAVKKMAGKDEAEAQKIVEAINKKIDDAYGDLDDKEGMTEVTKAANGKFTVKQAGR